MDNNLLVIIICIELSVLLILAEIYDSIKKREG